MPSPRHPQSFRRAFVDALSLCHVESVFIGRAVDYGPLMPLRRPGGVGRMVGKRNVSVAGYARRALAHDYTAALDSLAGFDFRGAGNTAYDLLGTHENGGPWVAGFFFWRSPSSPVARFDVSGIWTGGGPHGSQSSGMEIARQLITEALDTWHWLDENTYTPLDATLAAEARAVVADARADYVSRLNAKFGAGAYE